jgi:ATP-dependent RNA helicase DBP3
MVVEPDNEARVKKSKKERRKELASIIHQEGLNENDSMSSPQPLDEAVDKGAARKERKRKRKEIEAEGESVDTTPKKKQKSHHQDSPGANGDMELARGTSTENGVNGMKKEEKHKKKKLKGPDTLALGSTSPPSDIQEYLARNSIAIHGDVTPILSFSSLDIPDQLRQCLLTFKEPTPIQACTWPPLLAGQDVVGIAETGR